MNLFRVVPAFVIAVASASPPTVAQVCTHPTLVHDGFNLPDGTPPDPLIWQSDYSCDMCDVVIDHLGGKLRLEGKFCQVCYQHPDGGLGVGVVTHVGFKDFAIEFRYEGEQSSGFAYGVGGAFDADVFPPASVGTQDISERFVGFNFTLTGNPVGVHLGDGSAVQLQGVTAEVGDLFRVVGSMSSSTLTFYKNESEVHSVSAWAPIPTHWVAGLYARPGASMGDVLTRYYDDFDADVEVPSIPTIYCTAKTTSTGCVPAIGFTGSCPSATTGAFRVTCVDVPTAKNGILFYGKQADNLPFQGGFLCAAAPITRTPLQNSGGDPFSSACEGGFVFNFTAWIQSKIDPTLIPGTSVFAQYWFRDPPASFGSGLSDAVRFFIGS